MGLRRALVLAAVVLAALAPILAGCGGDSSTANEFGPPPSPAAGVHAWAVGEAGDVLFTDDGGASWQRRAFGLSARAIDVAFSDASHGWLVTDDGTVLATEDGGVSWDVRRRTELRLFAVASTDADHVWALGDAGAVLRSDDGGRTWTRRGFGDSPLADVVFADARHGWLVGFYQIWATGDGGETWRLRESRDMAVLKGVACSDARHAWVVGWGTQDGAPLVLATLDGGASWRRQRIDLPESASGNLQLEQVTCAGESSLWATCGAGVVASADGGRTWVLQKVPGGAASFCIAAADGQHILATTNGQPILATSDGGDTWRAFGKAGYLEQSLGGISAVTAADAE